MGSERDHHERLVDDEWVEWVQDWAKQFPMPAMTGHNTSSVNNKWSANVSTAKR